MNKNKNANNKGTKGKATYGNLQKFVKSNDLNLVIKHFLTLVYYY